jgi:hypothetical protein
LAQVGFAAPKGHFSMRASEPWHADALRLFIERRRTPSRWLSALLSLELLSLRLRHLDLRGQPARKEARS